MSDEEKTANVSSLITHHSSLITDPPATVRPTDRSEPPS
jgi:hypothetical protein